MSPNRPPPHLAPPRSPNPRRVRAGAHARKMGLHFENVIREHFALAKSRKVVAWFYKLEPPAKWVGKRGHVKMVASDHGPADWIAQLDGDATAIVAESKSNRAENPLMLHEIKKHQRQHLDDCVRGGGIALLLVEFRTEEPAGVVRARQKFAILLSVATRTVSGESA